MTYQQHNSHRIGSYGKLGLLLALIGIILAVDTMMDLAFLYKLWPILTIILGIGFIRIYIQRSRQETPYMGIGIYLIAFSGLTLFCNLTSWTALVNLWPLFITFMGISFVFGYLFGSKRPILLLTGLLFFSLSLMFFFVFSFDNQFWWTIFIFAGISFFIFDKVRNI